MEAASRPPGATIYWSGVAIGFALAVIVLSLSFYALRRAGRGAEGDDVRHWYQQGYAYLVFGLTLLGFAVWNVVRQAT